MNMHKESKNIPLTNTAETINLPSGTTLYQSGDIADGIFIVKKGILKVLAPSSINRKRIADLYGEGDVLATAAIDNKPHHETVIAVHDCILYPLNAEESMNNRKLREYILKNLAKQLRRNRELIDDSELPVGARVTRSFFRLSQRFGQEPDENGMVKLPLSLTHEDLASLTGSSRVTITRILGELRNKGVVLGTRGVYLVNQVELEIATDSYVLQVI